VPWRKGNGRPGWTQHHCDARTAVPFHATDVPPYGALRTAPSGILRRLASCAVWHLAPFGILRRSSYRAVRHIAPFGISRGSAVGDVRQSATFGSRRRSAYRAVRQSATFGIRRRLISSRCLAGCSRFAFGRFPVIFALC
jgi:hypothetical protein